MTDLDDRIVPKVAEIVAKYGKTLTFYNNAGNTASYDPATGVTTEPTEATETAKATPPEPIIRRNEDGSTSSTGEMQTYLPAQGLDATFFGQSFGIGSRVDFDSTSWSVKQYDPIYSGDQIACYRLVLGLRRDTRA